MGGLDLSQFGSGGNKPYSWDGKQIGSFVEGQLIESRSQQQKEFKGKGKPPGEPLFWKDGNPRMQLVLTVQTDEREPGDEQDTGARDVYLPSYGDTFKRIIRAVQAHGSETLEDGAKVRVTWISGAGVTGDGRQFGFDYQPPVKGTNLGSIPTPEPVAQAPAPQANPDPWAVQPSTPPPAAPPIAQQAPAPTAATPQIPAGAHGVTQAQYDQFKTMGLDMAQFVVVPG